MKGQYPFLCSGAEGLITRPLSSAIKERTIVRGKAITMDVHAEEAPFNL